jgi:hypothetical protein
MSLPDLAAVLWRQREVIEQLAYKLECEQLLMASGRTARLGQSISEVEGIAEKLQLLEMQRAEAADRAAAELGLPPGSGLAEIAGSVQPPWTEVLLEHRTALLTLTAELKGLADSTRTLAEGGMAALDTALASIGGQSGTAANGYDARGRVNQVAGRGAMVVDRAL